LTGEERSRATSINPIPELEEGETAYGGETTLDRDSLFASELVENAVKSNVFSSRREEINAALSSLKEIVSKRKEPTDSQKTRSTFNGRVTKITIRDLEMPPIEVTNKALEHLNGKSFQKCPDRAMLNREQMILCKS
jgi:hypothetical protein